MKDFVTNAVEELLMTLTLVVLAFDTVHTEWLRGKEPGKRLQGGGR